MIIDFIDDALDNGLSVLLASARGKCRSAAACVAYIMSRYSWGFDKSHQYLRSKKPDIDINESFVRQLISLERKQLMKRVAKRDESYRNVDLMRMKDWNTSYISKMKLLVSEGSTEYENLDEELLLVVCSTSYLIPHTMMLF